MILILWVAFMVDFPVSGQEVDLSLTPAPVVPTVLTMCYFIERNTSGLTYDYDKAQAALDLATTHVNDFILPPEIQIRSVYSDIGRDCTAKTHVVGMALKQREQGINCSVYIGPGCGLAAEIFSDLISVWDKPIIGCPASDVGLSAPASDYTVISRTSITYSVIAGVFIRFFKAYNYTTPAVFLDQSASFFQQLGVLMQQYLRKGNPELQYGASFISFRSAKDSVEALQARLTKATTVSRVGYSSAAHLSVEQSVARQNGLFYATDLHQPAVHHSVEAFVTLS
ncbi:hypothetical protein BV898_15270 [Hypsibius exemplaris]|uniref:Receptor ligand binding region domain-containing protein n=1 Tax=Hypsibius exemplaris TaxID=2072580 RepID=A0A9X6RK70_HYPEX|nr:hypothetical protein BV898_15270 [Hypsibius exemplaris]